MIRDLFGVKINDIDMDSAVDTFLNGKYEGGAGFSYVVTPNVDHFQRLESEPNSIFHQAYLNASFRFCDSRVIQKFALFKGYRVQNVVPGSDLTYNLLLSPAVKKKRIMMVGPPGDEVSYIAEAFNLNDVISHSPPMGFIDNDVAVQEAVKAVADSNAEFVFIAVGSPQQELLALKIKEHFDSVCTDTNMTAFCIGASLDFLTGKQTRAPKILQKLHLEWLHRALSSPRKLVPRYYRNFLWLCKVLCKRKRIIDSKVT